MWYEYQINPLDSFGEINVFLLAQFFYESPCSVELNRRHKTTHKSMTQNEN